MSVTFKASVYDEAYQHCRPMFPCACADWCDSCQERELNLANVNARDLLDWLCVTVADELAGDIKASDLAARCRRRLWAEARNHDAGIPTIVTKTPGHATSIDNGRPPDYLRQRTERLLHVAELAGDHHVSWS